MSTNKLNLNSGSKLSEEVFDKIDNNFENVQTEIDTNENDIVTLANKVNDVFSPLTITLILDKNVIEMGSTVNSITANWTCSKAPNSQTFEGESIDATVRTKIYNGEITSDKTFTLTATTDGGTTISVSKTLSFVNGIYYGVSSSTSYNSSLISSLTKMLSGVKTRTITVNSTSNTYIYYCLPKRLCTTEPSFTVNGFVGGFSNIATVSFTNSSSFTEDYYIYKSNYSGLGSTTVTIN
jgi:hypothetical protein